MAILNIDYGESELKLFNIPDKIMGVLETLSDYCDEHTLPNSDGCFNCPFYMNNIEATCLLVKNGYGIPCNWVVYKEDEGGDINT